jgi:hypothetical protein
VRVGYRIIPIALALAVIVGACGGEADAERSASEFSELAATGDRAACELVEPAELEDSGGCEAFLDGLTDGPGAESCLQQLDVTRSSASSDGSTVVAFTCGPTSQADGESAAFGEYELVEEDGRWLIRDGYIRGR